MGGPAEAEPPSLSEYDEGYRAGMEAGARRSRDRTLTLVTRYADEEISTGKLAEELMVPIDSLYALRAAVQGTVGSPPPVGAPTAADPDHLAMLNDMDVVPEDTESVRCRCEWLHPVDGSVDARWPAELDPACPVHAPEDVRGADVGEARDSLAAELEGARDAMMVDEDWEPSYTADVMTRAAAALRSPEPAAEPSAGPSAEPATGRDQKMGVTEQELASAGGEPPPSTPEPFTRPVRVVEEPPVWDVMTDTDRVAICEDRVTAEYIAAAINAYRPAAPSADGETCRIHEYDGAYRCTTHNRLWGAVKDPDEPCEPRYTLDEVERRRWMEALAAAVCEGELTVSQEAEVLAWVNGYTGERRVLDDEYYAAAMLRMRSLRSRGATTETGETDG
jgi:hypothetical protein